MTTRSNSTRAEHWRAVLADWKRSGLTQRAYCQRKKISVGTLAWWKHRLAGRTASSAPKFLAVRVRADGPAAGTSAVRPEAAPGRATPLELQLPDGTRVSVGPTCDPALLVRVLAALRSGQC